MITHKTLKWIVGIFVFGFIITNCVVNRKITEPTQVAILPTSSSTQRFPTLEPTKTFSITSFPTSSVEQYSPTPTSTPTRLSTPDAQAREKLWREIMVKPICSLPCWWGIKPGINSEVEAQELLKPLAIRLDLDSSTIPDGSVLYGAPFDFFELSLYNNLSLVEKKEVIESIHVNGFGIYNPEEFRKIWKRYGPEEIVRLYGSPSRILLQTWQHTPQPRDPTYKYYELSLFYDQLGFIILYHGKIENKPNYTVCPAFSGNLIEEIDIYIKSLASQVPLEDLIGEQGGPRESAYSLQEASELTIQQFYNLISKNQESACFDTKADIWPK